MGLPLFRLHFHHNMCRSVVSGLFVSSIMPAQCQEFVYDVNDHMKFENVLYSAIEIT